MDVEIGIRNAWEYFNTIHGSLQHVSFVYQHGHHHLPSISAFLSKFHNEYVLHHIPKPCVNQITWWSQILALTKPIFSLVRLPDFDPDIWVDASSVWGIGIIIDSHWAAWRLLFGWKSEG